jgi:hypothetical protein
VFGGKTSHENLFATFKTKMMENIFGSKLLNDDIPTGQNKNIRIADESLENVAKFKYLGATLTNQNDIHD